MHTRFPDGAVENIGDHDRLSFLGHSFTFNDWDVRVHDKAHCEMCVIDRQDRTVSAAVLRVLFPADPNDLPFE